MTTPLKWVCMKCKNYAGANTCLAFPEGIPQEIYEGRNDHKKPLPEQQNDIVFEKVEGDTAKNT